MKTDLTLHHLPKRDVSYDILRFIGIALIILAHIGPPENVLQIRSFDVPLMMFISGLVLSSRNNTSTFKYTLHRVLRLIKPVYLFLVVYFSLIFIAKGFGIDLGVTSSQVIGTFLLQDGIGFVWIIRVMILIALITPAIQSLRNKLSYGLICIVITFTLLVIGILVAHGIGMKTTLVRDWIIYAIGYGIPFIAGLYFPTLDLKVQLLSTVVIFVLLVIDYVGISCNWNIANIYNKTESGGVLIFNNFKYPPQPYFLLYGLFMSCVCYLIIVRLKTYKYLMLFEFIGCNTIWIYLYHIPLVQITGRFNLHWSVRYIIVFTIAALLTYIQVKTVERLQKKYNWAMKLNFLKG